MHRTKKLKQMHHINDADNCMFTERRQNGGNVQRV